MWDIRTSRRLAKWLTGGSSVRIHHLNCGTMRPRGRRVISGEGGLLEEANLVCHCLLLETSEGLVLVDTGFGTGDIEDPNTSLGGAFLRRVKPSLDLHETALRQVIDLGYRPRDVRHIVVTHFDPDHLGGLRDFPWAAAHVHAREYQAATHPTTRRERHRYRPIDWSGHQNWMIYGAEAGERWLAFEGVQQLRGLPDDLLLVPLFGHTRGHVGVAVASDAGWLLHAGDSYFSRREVAILSHICPARGAFLGAITQVDGAARKGNLHRLRELSRSPSHIGVFSAHDAEEFERHRTAGTGAGR